MCLEGKYIYHKSNLITTIHQKIYYKVIFKTVFERAIDLIHTEIRRLADKLSQNPKKLHISF